MPVAEVLSLAAIPNGARRRLSDALVSECPPELWVIMSRTGPLFVIKDSAATETAAQTTFADRGYAEDEYVIVGPVSGVRLAPPVNPVEVEDLVTCHLCDTEPCQEQSLAFRSPSPLREDVARIVLKYEFVGGADPITFEFNRKADGRLADAFFLTRGARRRFLYPYYQALYGGDYVEALRAHYGDVGAE